MKVPISWLKEYVDFNATPEQLAERLTFSGVEVEGIDVIGSTFENVVVGEVVSVVQHPGADKLVLCTVRDGRDEVQVVCGAPNVAAGMKAPFARIGAVLPNGMKIEKRKVRGEISMGMLCAEDELGLSDSHAGLMVLAADLPAGTPFSEIAGPPETVLDLEITWNRPDCLSIIGIARELASLFGAAVRRPVVELRESDKPTTDLISVSIDDAQACPRYAARALENVRLRPSPPWMQKRLSLCGVRPINNVVDITNYVMLECGHPLHAFDRELLADGQIVVRRVKPGERMATLDGIERKLTPDMLVIADGRKPVALAGIMGGAGSEILDTTRTVMLESASFDPAVIKRTSTALGLSTESSHRFERGVDVGGVEWASRRAASLMAELADASPARGVIDVYPGERPPRRVTCSFNRTRALIGVNIPDETITGILESLGMRPVEAVESGAVFEVPTYRPDLEIEADLVEEVARIHGLDKIPTAAPASRIVPGADDTRTRAVSQCRRNLASLGLLEIVNYSFLSPSLLDMLASDDVKSRVLLANPVSADLSVMRTSLVPQMVETLGRNASRQNLNAALFEMGKIYRQSGDGRISEHERVSIGLMGNVGRTRTDRIRKIQPQETFLWLKGIVEALVAAHRLEALTLEPVKTPYLQENSAVSLSVGDWHLGIMGLLNENIRHEWRMSTPVAVAELDLNILAANIFHMPNIKPMPAYPCVTRDAAMIVGTDVTHEKIMRVIASASPPELTNIELFDIYYGEAIGKDRKSLAYSFTYRSMERTLTDEDANRYHDVIKSALRNELGAEIREN